MSRVMCGREGSGGRSVLPFVCYKYICLCLLYSFKTCRPKFWYGCCEVTYKAFMTGGGIEFSLPVDLKIAEQEQ